VQITSINVAGNSGKSLDRNLHQTYETQSMPFGSYISSVTLEEKKNSEGSNLLIELRSVTQRYI
jgi:hypothetical protein